MAPVLIPLALVIGFGATACIDLWALLLKRAFGVRSLDFCLLGRWILHMPSGTFVHASIAKSAAKAGECAFGWVAHYSIGGGLAVAFVLLVTRSWLERPTLAPAVAFGLVTAAIPLFVMQPALGLGIASAKTPNPAQARLKSIVTHTVFGLGLYLSARLLSLMAARG